MVKLLTFKGLFPQLNAHNLPEDAATVAQNVKLLAGSLKSWKNLLDTNTPTKAGTKTSIFFYDNAYWLAWTEDVNVAKSPIANDTYKRLYWTGQGVPKMAPSTAIINGGTDYPNASYTLGIPAPTPAPVVSVKQPPEDGTAAIPVTVVARSTAGVVTLTSMAHGLDDGSWFALKIVGTGFSSLGNKLFNITVVDANSYTLDDINSVASKAITAITKANPGIVTSKSHGLLTGDTIKIAANGMTQIHGWEGQITVVTANTFKLGLSPTFLSTVGYSTFTSGSWELVSRTVSYSAQTITALTAASPARVTCAAHGKATGDRIKITISAGMTELNDWEGTITKIDANRFTLDDVNSTAYGAFTAGTFQEVCGWLIEIDELEVEGRAYVYTYVSAYGEEGPPSEASVTIETLPGQTVNLSGLSGAPAGSYNITTKNVYRTNTGSSSTEYQFVASVPVAQDTYSDTILSAALGEVLLSTLWDPPPSDLKGLIDLPNGSLAGYSGNEVCVSVPYQPHAWPVNQRYPMSAQIMGLGAYGNNVLIPTKDRPYVCVLGDVANLQPEKLENGYACVSKRGVVDIGYAVAYPSTVGLVVVGVNGINLVTEGILDKDAWKALNPETLSAYFYGGFYFGFTSNATFIINLSTGDYVNLTTPAATGGFHDPSDGSLYLITAGVIQKWDAGTGNISYVWESRPFTAPKPANPSCAQVFAESYPATFKLYADGVLKHTQTVANRKPFRLPAKYLAEDFRVRIEGTAEVYHVAFAESMEELRQS